MEPVRIKYYGLVWMTRRTYLIVTGVVGLIGVVLLFSFWRADRLPPFRWPWEPLRQHDRQGIEGAFADHFWTIILVCVLAELIDIIATLRAFAQESGDAG